MKRLNSHVIGIDQGDVVLFSDFEDEGEMWSGTGPRMRMHSVTFSEPFTAPPAVMVSMTMFDMSSSTNSRADVQAENTTAFGFDIVFRTWEDTKIARVRVGWQAIGALVNEDTWDI